MKITWVTRSFLDYRIPVYKEIDRLSGNNLSVIYFSDVVPQRCQYKLRSVLKERAIGVTGEFRIGGKKRQNQEFANAGGLRITVRPGLTRLLKKTRADVILSDGFFQWTYAALMNNALWDTPHVMCYERTLHTERNASKIRTTARKAASRYINSVCCNGVLSKEYIQSLGFPEERIYLGNMTADISGLQNAISKTDSTEIDNLLNHSNIKGPVFLYSGQLIPRKGVNELLSAWAKFSQFASEPTLVLVGDGKQKQELSDYIKEKHIENVTLAGSVDYSEIHLYYQIADIFIIPTLEDNWSLVVPEAMSCGLPIICSKYNGCWPELVKPENGWVFDPLDEDDFLETLKNAWDAKDRWSDMGNESLKIVNDFTPEKIASNIFKVCLEVGERL